MRALALAACLATLCTTDALAQGPAGHRTSAAARAASPDWARLSPAQREALAPLQGEWGSLDADRRQQWLDVASRFPRMAPAERQRVQARMTQWAAMSPSERGQARVNFQELRELTPEERQARWAEYQALSPEQRRKLAARAHPANGGARALRPAPSSAGKSNMVSPVPPRLSSGRPVGPAEVQAKPGATTTLISRRPLPPAHQQPGMPKVATTPGFVDRRTLLPERGAQGAGVRRANRAHPAASAPSRP
jgi:hypothetical protein